MVLVSSASMNDPTDGISSEPKPDSARGHPLPPHRSAAGTVTLQGTVYLHILVKYLSMENCLFIFCNAYVCANMLIGIYCSMRVT